jgi:hypothetical protein
VRYDDKHNSQKRKRITLENEKRTEQNRQLTIKQYLPYGKKREKHHSIEHAKTNENRLATKKEKKKKSTKR